MKSFINEPVIQHVDHKNINLEVAFMQNKMASTEVIAQSIFEVLKPAFDQQGVLLHAVRLHETENNYAEYFGSNSQ